MTPQTRLTKDDIQAINQAAHARAQAEFARIRNDLVERAKAALAAGRDWHEVLQ
jgi:hypothetical protein